MAVVNTKVLLVDDSKFLRMANERALSKAGFEVSMAADGEEALQVANAKPPDIILLDMLLPKLQRSRRSESPETKFRDQGHSCHRAD